MGAVFASPLDRLSNVNIPMLNTTPRADVSREGSLSLDGHKKYVQKESSMLMQSM